MKEQVADALAYPEQRGWDRGVTVLDRWYYPSDIVNEIIYTGNESVLEHDRIRIEDKLLELDTHLVYVTAPLDIIHKRYLVRGDEFVGFEQIEKVYHLYEEFMKVTKLPVITLFTNLSTPQICVNQIANQFHLEKI